MIRFIAYGREAGPRFGPTPSGLREICGDSPALCCTVEPHAVLHWSLEWQRLVSRQYLAPTLAIIGPVGRILTLAHTSAEWDVARAASLSLSLDVHEHQGVFHSPDH